MALLLVADMGGDKSCNSLFCMRVLIAGPVYASLQIPIAVRL